MPDDAWPPELKPTRLTLKQLEERQLLVRRGRAWHLRRHWYSRVQALRQRAVNTPALSSAKRPAPDLPTYAELKAFEALCLYLDGTPKCCARLPFSGWAARIEGIENVMSIEGDMPITLLKLMRHDKLVRHTSKCEWALSPKWHDRLQMLWAVYVRTVGQMLTRDWYTLESCEILTRLDIVAQLVVKYPDRYPSVGWAVRGVLDKAISSVIALCQARPDQANRRLAAFLEARRGQSVTAIAREWDLSREYISRTVGRQAILLVTEKVLAISRISVRAET